LGSEIDELTGIFSEIHNNLKLASKNGEPVLYSLLSDKSMTASSAYSFIKDEMAYEKLSKKGKVSPVLQDNVKKRSEDKWKRYYEDLEECMEEVDTEREIFHFFMENTHDRIPHSYIGSIFKNGDISTLLKIFGDELYNDGLRGFPVLLSWPRGSVNYFSDKKKRKIAVKRLAELMNYLADKEERRSV
jgi:hypothetical protein